MHNLGLFSHVVLLVLSFSMVLTTTAQDTISITDSSLIYASFVDEHIHAIIDESCHLSLILRKEQETVFYKTDYCTGIWANEQIPESMSVYPVQAIAYDSIYSESDTMFFQFERRWIKIPRNNYQIDSALFTSELTKDPDVYYDDDSWYYKDGLKVDSVMIDDEGYKVYVVTNCDSSMFNINPHYMYLEIWFSERYGEIRYIWDGNGYGHCNMFLDSFIEYRLGEYETYYRHNTVPMKSYIKSLKRIY